MAVRHRDNNITHGSAGTIISGQSQTRSQFDKLLNSPVIGVRRETAEYYCLRPRVLGNSFIFFFSFSTFHKVFRTLTTDSID